MTATTDGLVEQYQPDDGQLKIWRYVDLPKFLTLIQNRSLYFCRLDKLGDPHEGSWTMGDRTRRLSFLKRSFEEMGVTKRDGKPLDLDRDNFLSNREVRKWFFVNCWHANDIENVAMWKLYGKGEGSVAVQTTYQKLTNSLPDSVPIQRIKGNQAEYENHPTFVAQIDYKDYSNPSNTIGGSGLPGESFFLPFVHKRKEFEHEREVRAMVCAPFSTHTGLEIEIDIDIIESIIVYPGSPNYVKEATSQLLQDYGVGDKIIKSELDSDPHY